MKETEMRSIITPVTSKDDHGMVITNYITVSGGSCKIFYNISFVSIDQTVAIGVIGLHRPEGIVRHNSSQHW